MFYKNSFIGSYNISNNTLYNIIDSIQDMKLLTLSKTSTYTQNNNNQFQKLTITNTYQYVYNPSYVAIDNYNKNTVIPIIFENNTIYIRYDNFYDDNSTIILYIDDIVTSYDTVSSVLYNQSIYLCIYQYSES
jgi:hypothetical protein